MPNSSKLEQVRSWHPADIAYCSNVHGGESVAEIKRNLRMFIQPVRQQRRLKTMATGLWISGAAARDLQDAEVLADFQHEMDSSGLSLTSINGFPYGDFHRQQVKESVYLPDWADSDRLQYTKNLADILAACLPGDCQYGAISTVPLGYKSDWCQAKQQRAWSQLLELTEYLEKIKQRTGKQILVCPEMEPDCVLESTDELIDFFECLRNEDHPRIRHPEYLAVCYDVCHQAVMHEQAYEALARITEAGIRIGKIQLSSALQVNFNGSLTADNPLLELLGQFSEPKYLHQVKTIDHKGQLVSSSDLSRALSSHKGTNSQLSFDRPWRVHFHVPVNAKQLSHPRLKATDADLHQVFDFLHDHPAIRPWLEVETYSWQVLPEGLRPANDAELIAGITDELRWVEEQLVNRECMVE